MPRVHRIAFSTNADRVALAAGLKGVAIEWVDHTAQDRSAIRALSGQDFVPVLETDAGEVIVDSPVILRWLDEHAPQPPLWPADPALRARADVIVEYFNGVWKRAPNAIADGTSDDPAGDASRLADSAGLFEGLLSDADWLAGDELTVADVVVWPFLELAATERHPDDTDPFHAVIREHMDLGPRTRAWCKRVRELPRS